MRPSNSIMQMKKNFSFLSNKYKGTIESNRKLVVSSIIIILIIIFFLFQKYQLTTDGVFTICQVDHYEAAGSGGNLYIDIFYQDKKYHTAANTFCSGCEGKYFFVKIIKNQPEGVVVFMRDYPVPDCILNKPIPKQGWEIIPTCN